MLDFGNANIDFNALESIDSSNINTLKDSFHEYNALLLRKGELLVKHGSEHFLSFASSNELRNTSSSIFKNINSNLTLKEISNGLEDLTKFNSKLIETENPLNSINTLLFKRDKNDLNLSIKRVSQFISILDQLSRLKSEHIQSINSSLDNSISNEYIDDLKSNLIDLNYNICITHGNGPQVGNELLKAEPSGNTVIVSGGLTLGRNIPSTTTEKLYNNAGTLYWDGSKLDTNTITALNNQAQSRLVSIGSTTTELDGEANLTFTGSALTCIGTVTVGVDGTGHDVTFYGDTASSYMLWDESADSLLLNAATLDLNGTADSLILDADGDTTISSPSDDQIDFEIAGADDFTMTANTFTILSGSTIAIAAGGAITNAGTMAPDITSTGKALVMGF